MRSQRGRLTCNGESPPVPVDVLCRAEFVVIRRDESMAPGAQCRLLGVYRVHPQICVIPNVF